MRTMIPNSTAASVNGMAPMVSGPTSDSTSLVTPGFPLSAITPGIRPVIQRRSEDTCLERVRSPRERGVLLRFHVEVDLTLPGRGLQAITVVRLRPPTRAVIERFRDSVPQMPEVISIFVLTGIDDSPSHVAVRDTDHPHSVVSDELTERQEFADVHTSVAYAHLRKNVIDPMRGRQGRRSADRWPPGCLP
ncbi:Lrp/AsnC family transcriptional regulator [Streptomyces sp. NPDC002276]